MDTLLTPFKWASRSLIKLRLILSRKTEKINVPLKWSYHPESFHVFPFPTQEGLWPCTSQLRPQVKIVLAGFRLLIWNHPPLNCSTVLTYQHPPSVIWEQTLIHSSLHFSEESLRFWKSTNLYKFLHIKLSTSQMVAARPTKSCLSQP